MTNNQFYERCLRPVGAAVRLPLLESAELLRLEQLVAEFSLSRIVDCPRPPMWPHPAETGRLLLHHGQEPGALHVMGGRVGPRVVRDENGELYQGDGVSVYRLVNPLREVDSEEKFVMRYMRDPFGDHPVPELLPGEAEHFERQRAEYGFYYRGSGICMDAPMLQLRAQLDTQTATIRRQNMLAGPYIRRQDGRLRQLGGYMLYVRDQRQSSEGVD